MTLKTKSIAILGSTGHIGKGLVYNLSQTEVESIFLFTRSEERLVDFLNQISCNRPFFIKSFTDFHKYNYDVVINCVGLGTPEKVKKAGGEVFKITEEFDNMVLGYLARSPETIYINFSSGAVYGNDFVEPVSDYSFSKWSINNIRESDYYGIAKLYSEAKHRALRDFNIVDLRVFGYFSRFIDLSTSFLLCEIISCIKNNREFLTTQENIVRDYIHPKDLFSFVEKCIIKGNINDVFDVYSRKPATKFEILDYFKNNYGLRYVMKENINVVSVTGLKKNYYSTSKKAGKVGYEPEFTSIECIAKETELILKNL